MSDGYISPIPAETRTDYEKRVAGRAIERRMHLFEQADGRVIACRPEACRECYRESAWCAGQTRGEG